MIGRSGDLRTNDMFFECLLGEGHYRKGLDNSHQDKTGERAYDLAVRMDS